MKQAAIFWQPVGLCHIFCRHCEEQSDVAIHLAEFTHGLLRFTRNDEKYVRIPDV